MIIATSDATWCAQVEAAVAPHVRELGLSPRRLLAMEQMHELLCQPARIWVMDESLLAPLLQCRRSNDLLGQPLPCMILRCAPTSGASVVALIESGVRGCLPQNSTADEALHAVHAVLSGELWVSRRVLSDMLAASQRRANSADVTNTSESAVLTHSLTTRQREIAACVARGLSNKQIGRQLGISPTTVKTHLHNIFGRIGIGGRTLLALHSNGEGSEPERNLAFAPEVASQRE